MGLKIVQWFLLGTGMFSMLLGTAGFFFVSNEEKKWVARREIVERGEISPVEAKVVAKRIRKSSSGTGTSKTFSRRYQIQLGITAEKSTTRTVNKETYNSIAKGQTFQVYPVDGVYFIPQFDAQDYSFVKWFILLGSSLPLLGGFLVLIVRKIMAR